MSGFRIKITDRYDGSQSTPYVSADILLDGEVVGFMTRFANGHYWCNGVGSIYCHLKDACTWPVFGRYNPVLQQFSDVTQRAKKELWTMPRAQKELNRVLKAAGKPDPEKYR